MKLTSKGKSWCGVLTWSAVTHGEKPMRRSALCRALLKSLSSARPRRQSWRRSSRRESKQTQTLMSSITRFLVFLWRSMASTAPTQTQQALSPNLVLFHSFCRVVAVPVPQRWKALYLISGSSLFNGGPGSVVQGGCGTSWFLGAVAAVSTLPHGLEGLFLTADIDAGVYGIKFQKEGDWVFTVVDSLIAVDAKGTQVFYSLLPYKASIRPLSTPYYHIRPLFSSPGVLLLRESTRGDMDATPRESLRQAPWMLPGDRRRNCHLGDRRSHRRLRLCPGPHPMDGGQHRVCV